MKTRQLNEDEVHIFVNLEVSSSVDELFEGLQATDGGWVLKAIEKRFEAHKVEAEKKVMIAVLAIGDGRVGVCAKHIDYIVDFCNKNNKRADWDTFTKQIYHNEIPVL